MTIKMSKVAVYLADAPPAGTILMSKTVTYLADQDVSVIPEATIRRRGFMLVNN